MSLRKIAKLKNREYRNAYVSAQIEQGLAFQIRAMRESRGWDQKMLALKIGQKSQSSIARIEDPSYGKQSIATLKKIAKAFDVALTVRFSPYSKLIIDTQDLSSAKLVPRSFEQELPALEKQVVTTKSQSVFDGVLAKTPEHSFSFSQYAAARPNVTASTYL